MVTMVAECGYTLVMATDPSVDVPAYMPSSLAQAIRDQAKAEHRSMSALIREACTRYLDGQVEERTFDIGGSKPVVIRGPRAMLDQIEFIKVPQS
jgi:hypothetical protein